MKTFIKFLITAVMLLGTVSSQAQSTVYPIQLNAVLLPPYTNCLGDYFNSGANRAQVKAILRDISKYDKNLHFSLSVKVKMGNTVMLESVTPYPIELSNANVINDLRDYVKLLFTPEAQNRGVRSSGNYANNGYCLPEGSYEFVFQVFDYYKKNVPLSEPFSMFCYLNQAEAPVALYPEDGACGINKAIGIYDNGVQFQWMDPIATGPSQKVYEFVLTEKHGGTNLVGNMFSDASESNVKNMALYNDKVFNNTFRYIPNTSSIFQNGKEYCWYVVAKGGNITGEKDDYYAFKNKGKSNVNCFTYGDCPAKEEIFDNSKVKKTDDKLKVVLEKVDVDQDKKNAEATWKSESGDFCKYYVYYFRKDLTDASAEKAEIKDLITLSTVLNNLEPGYEYSCYVIGATNCDKENEGEILSPKSNEITFKVDKKEEEEDKCDANLDVRACENLLEELNVKDYFYGTTNSEIITVTEVTKNSDNTFSGKGIVSCTIFKNKLGLNVTFNNISINSDRYLCKGEVKVVHSDTDNLVLNLNEFAGKKQGAEKAKQQENLGKEVNSLDEAKNYKNQTIIYNGKLYAVDAEGNHQKVGEVLEKGKLCNLPGGGLDNEDGTIEFDVEKGLNGEKYDPYIDNDPDPFSSELVKKSYEWQSSNYPIAWVAMVEGEVRWITAEIGDKKQAESTLKIEDVDFYCYAADGNAVKLEKETYGKKVKLKIYGGTKNTSMKIYARKKAEKVDGECPNDEKTVGVLNVYTMSHQTKKILLAPVLNEMTLNIEDMQKAVNKMFAPLGKQFEFTKGNTYTAEDDPYLKLILADGLNTNENDKHFTNETDEMKYIRQTYKQYASNFSDYDACLFLIPTAQKEGLQGFMPLNKSVGYIIVGEDANVKLDANTIAHELCHGLYDIQHVFDYNGVTEGNLAENIMDYPAAGTTVPDRYLTKYFQWAAVENGQLIHLSFLDDTEDSEIFDQIAKFGKCTGKAAVKFTISKLIESAFDDRTEAQRAEDEANEGPLGGFVSGLKDFGDQWFDDCKDEFSVGKNWENIITGINLLFDGIKCMTDKNTTWQQCLCNSGIDVGVTLGGALLSKGLKRRFKSLSQEKKRAVCNSLYGKIANVKKTIERAIGKAKNESVVFDATYGTTAYTASELASKGMGKAVDGSDDPYFLIFNSLFTGNTDGIKKLWCENLGKNNANDDQNQTDTSNAQDTNTQGSNTQGSNTQNTTPPTPCNVSFDRNRFNLPSDARYSNGYVSFATNDGITKSFKATVRNCNVVSVAIDNNTIYRVDGVIYVVKDNKPKNVNELEDYTIVGDQIVRDGDIVPISSVYSGENCWNFFVAVTSNWLSHLTLPANMLDRRKYLYSTDLNYIWNKVEKQETIIKSGALDASQLKKLVTVSYDDIYSDILSSIGNETTKQNQLKMIIRTIASYLDSQPASNDFMNEKSFQTMFHNIIRPQTRLNSCLQYYASTNKYLKQEFGIEYEFPNNGLLLFDSLLSEFLMRMYYCNFKPDSSFLRDYSTTFYFMSVDEMEDYCGLGEVTLPYIIKSLE